MVELTRRVERGKWSAIHAAWVWLAFVLVIGNWASLYNAQANPEWPPRRILLWLLAMTTLYAFTALVLPSRADECTDLKDFERNHSRSYIWAHNVFAICVTLLIFGVLGIDMQSLRLAAAPLVGLALGLAAVWARRAWIKAVIAVLLVINGSVMTLWLLASMSR